MKIAPANCEHCGKVVPQSKSSIRNHMVKFHPTLHRTQKGPAKKPPKPIDRTKEYRGDKAIRKWRRFLKAYLKEYDEERRLMVSWIRQYTNLIHRDGKSIRRAKADHANSLRMKTVKQAERDEGTTRKVANYRVVK